MRYLIGLTFISMISLPTHIATASTQTVEAAYLNSVIAHGGGCRKNSPPGQCCHMDRKTGVVHCH